MAEENKYQNNVVVTGYSSNVKIYGKLLTFSVAIGVKQQDGSYKNGFLNCKGSAEKFETNKGDKVAVSGFMSFDFWSKDGKEEQKPVLVVQGIEVIETAEETEAKKSDKPKSEPKPKEEEPETDETEDTSDDEGNGEVPF